MDNTGNSTVVGIKFKPERCIRQYRAAAVSNDAAPEDAVMVTYTSKPSETIEPKQHSATVFDAAAYILEKLGRCTTMKLHKLLYYCQAWSLVWDDAPLFSEPIEAWANGPVVRTLFNCHRGLFELTRDNFMYGNSSLLTPVQKETIDSVLSFYGDKPVQWLVNLTHSESPWRDARKGLDVTERGNAVIGLTEMAEYYSSL